MAAPALERFTLACTCGWTHVASTRASATLWKRWHREQHTPPGSRLSDSGHVVTVARRDDTPADLPAEVL